MNPRLSNLLKGFVAAVVAVVTVHQGIVFFLDASGLIERQAWSLAPMGPFAVPTIVNGMFWGGLWGALLALVYGKIPGSAPWVKGLIFGWLIYIISNNISLPLIKGQALFYGLDGRQLLAVFLILSGFGAATAVIYDYLRRRT